MAPKISRWLRGKNKSSRSATVQETAAVQSIESDKDQKVLPTEETPLIRQNATSQNGNHDIDRDDTSDRPSNVASSLMLSDSLGESVREGIKSVSLRLDRMRRQISEVVAAHTGSIGYLGSYAIAVNSLTGPAMLELPAAYAVSGLIPTTATILFVCFLAAFCSLHMANSISKIPVGSRGSLSIENGDSSESSSTGNSSARTIYNHDFRSEVEFSAAFSAFWGKPWYFVTQMLFLGCITCLNISSIVDTSQVVDTVLGHTTGSFALQVGHRSRWVYWDAKACTPQELDEGICLPFAPFLKDDDGTVLFTMGTAATTLFFLPLALMDLKENTAWQIAGFLVLGLTSILFIIHFTIAIFSDEGLAHDGISGLSVESNPDRDSWDSEESLWGTAWDDLFGIVLFNFALVIAVPAWLYEREPHVDVPNVVIGSSCMSTVLYVGIGWLGNLAVPHVSSNFLASLMSGVYGVYMQSCACIFSLFIVGLGIPLFSVLTRLNLIGAPNADTPPICTRPVGNVLAVFLPFGAAWFLYDGKAITKLLSWGGILFTSIVAFILPISLALYVSKHSTAPGSVSVYGGFLKSPRSERISLQILLCLALASIGLALYGIIT